MGFSQLFCCWPASRCWEKTADSWSFFSEATSLSRCLTVRLTDRLVGPPSSSARWCLRHDRRCHVVLGCLGTDWIKSLPGWRIERRCQLDTFTSHTSLPPPPPTPSLLPPNLNSPPPPLLPASSEGNPGLKRRSPSFLSPLLWPPYGFSAPRKLVALQGFPSILGELLPLDFFPPRECSWAASRSVPSLSSFRGRLIASDRPPLCFWRPPSHLLRPSPPISADKKEVLVKINVASPLHLHLRHHAEKKKPPPPLPRFAAASISNARRAGRGENQSFIHGGPLFSWCAGPATFPRDESEKLFYIVTA